MKTPVYAICEQQKCRSASASAQSDHYLDSIIPLVSISEFSSLYLVSVAAQVALSLSWWKERFSHDVAHMIEIFSPLAPISQKQFLLL